MDFFDSLINDVYSALNDLPQKTYEHSVKDCWTDIGYNQVILQRDTAFQLSGTGFNLITTSDIRNQIIVIGDDLQSIRDDRPFARISLVQIDDENDEQSAYELIRKIEYVKYHYFPDGFMLRTSSRSHKEAVRVAKTAVRDGISFQKTGSLLIEGYRKIPSVKGACVIYVTYPEIDYSGFEKLAEKNNRITETLNHIVNSVNFDCSTCNLKAVCDEVEGMKELHFKMNGMK